MTKKTTDNDKLESLKKEVHGLALVINTESGRSENLKETVEKLEHKFDALAAKVESNKDDIIKGVKEEFVKYVEFKPVKAFVYGLIGLIGTIVVTALMALIIASPIQTKEQPVHLQPIR